MALRSRVRHRCVADVAAGEGPGARYPLVVRVVERGDSDGCGGGEAVVHWYRFTLTKDGVEYCEKLREGSVVEELEIEASYDLERGAVRLRFICNG